ncbi:MAG: hypothetical protein RMM08_04555 [Armatimonadota bacterium]|nr:hypothetical protein [bacterium]MDW8320613.1 hypothetical protein [Armatimonadota bacterium]
MENTLPVRRVWLAGLCFAALGMIPTFLRVHIETLRILPAVLRSLDASGLPIPDTLAWSSALVRWISVVGSSGLQVRPTLLAVVYLLLLVIAVRLATPSVLVWLGDRGSLLRLSALTAVWLLVELLIVLWIGNPSELPVQGLMLLCAAVCLTSALLWSEDGGAGWLFHRKRVNGWALARLTGGGIACGLVGALVLQFTGFDFGAALYRFMFDFPTVFVPLGGAQGLADLNPRGWLTFTGVSLAIAAVGSFCWASLWTAIVAPAQSYHQRIRALAAALVPLSLVTLAGVWLFYGVIIGRMDYERALPRMAEAEQIPFGVAGTDTVLLATSDGKTRVARIPFQTIVGFPNEPGVTYKVEQYLQARDYQTILARSLLVHLHDVRSIDWDPVRSLEVDRLCIERAPRLQFVQLMVETLSNCAVTPEAKRYLDWLDARTRPFRQSQRACQIMGDLYARFGDERKAQQWYERGEIPEEMRREASPTGKITGRIVWNGRPAEGVRVGVIRRENALPFTLNRPGGEQQVLVVRPFAWRTVAGVVATDSSGRFEFPPLPYGDYVLLLRVEARRLPPVPGAAQVEGLLPVVQVDAPVNDTGTIRVRATTEQPQRPDRAI